MFNLETRFVTKICNLHITYIVEMKDTDFDYNSDISKNNFVANICNLHPQIIFEWKAQQLVTNQKCHQSLYLSLCQPHVTKLNKKITEVLVSSKVYVIIFVLKLSQFLEPISRNLHELKSCWKMKNWNYSKNITLIVNRLQIRIFK